MATATAMEMAFMGRSHGSFGVGTQNVFAIEVVVCTPDADEGASPSWVVSGVGIGTGARVLVGEDFEGSDGAVPTGDVLELTKPDSTDATCAFELDEPLASEFTPFVAECCFTGMTFSVTGAVGGGWLLVPA
ncbi:hypothetical protein PG994_010987 [Apiospora phragmitis]|uniref:Uncharacterized protein n=1 Tax=Apiospora phragmitis TaxID=2905665 RepID=A0ABR1TRR2_9PEZI